MRLDAEFWQPAYLADEKVIRAGSHVALGALVSTFKKGIFSILAREYADHGIPFYRSSNVGTILPKRRWARIHHVSEAQGGIQNRARGW